MELTKIKSKDISWGYAAQSLNNNFDKIDTDVEKLKYATSKVKGFFKAEEALNKLVPQANEGEIAYIGSFSPYQIWEWSEGKWVDTYKTEGSINVNLSNYLDKEEAKELVKPGVYDGGRADSLYGGARRLDCGNAYQ